MAPKYLGPLAEGQWDQFSEDTGKIYFENTTTHEISHSIPEGHEDLPTDSWLRITGKTWAQWNNERTGRAVLIDPIPLSDKTYLEFDFVKALLLGKVKKAPGPLRGISDEPVIAVLSWAFQVSDGYQVVRVSDDNPDLKLDRSTIIIVMSWNSGGELLDQDFTVMKSKGADASWETTADELRLTLDRHCGSSKKMCGMVCIGLEIGFYEFAGSGFSSLVRPLHLVRDAKEVVTWFEYVKAQYPSPMETP
ncbi:hypothetical protein FQN54_003861 [Arachnomyces sp. PD_36]|nr:hypothetical protein FQN54_003861 [Arachnomyces sp. PD_36]